MSKKKLSTPVPKVSIVEQELRQSNQRLASQLIKEKNRTQELVYAVDRAARDAVSGLDFKPVKAPTKPYKSRNNTAEVSLINISDLQIAKITASYNSKVCQERIQLLADRVIRLTEIQREDHPVDHARINLLGDIVEGELIFPGQAHLIDASLYAQVTTLAPTILCEFIDRMLQTYKTVHVNGVIGNHGAIGGRSRRDHNPTTNADRMVYKIIADRYRSEPRITFNVPDTERERSWYIVDYPVSNRRTQKFGVLLFHGDQIRGGGFGGFPFYGVAKRIWGWRSGAVPERFQYAVFGHWHQATKITLGNLKVWCNGTSESANTYAQEGFASMGDPSQLMLFMHPKRGVTAEYEINLLK